MAVEDDEVATLPGQRVQTTRGDQVIEPQPSAWLHVPTHVWLRSGYWWYFAALGCFLPYIALYYQGLGFSGIEIGVLTSISPIAVALCAPLWGMLADTYAAHRVVLRVGLLVVACLAFVLTQTSNFWLILVLVAGIGAFGAPVPSLLDSYSMSLSTQQGFSYGQLRLWGSLGYSVATWLIGWWMGGTVTAAFLVMYAATALLACVATFGLPDLALRSRTSMWHGMHSVLAVPAMRVLLLTAFIAASGTGIVFNYFGIYVAALGGSAELLGVSNAIASLCEMPVLLFGAYLLDRFGSRRALILAVTLYVLRFATYTVIPSAGWIIPIQLVHGFTFGAFLMASVTLAYQLVDRQHAATAQGLLTAMSYGFGAIVGSLLGGALLDLIGVIALYRVATVLMVLALGVLLLGLRTMRETVAEQH